MKWIEEYGMAIKKKESFGKAKTSMWGPGANGFEKIRSNNETCSRHNGLQKYSRQGRLSDWD